MNKKDNISPVLGPKEEDCIIVGQENQFLQAQVRQQVNTIQSHITSYGRVALKPDKIKEVHDEITSDFLKYFQGK